MSWHWASAVAPTSTAFPSQWAVFSLWESWGKDNWTLYHQLSVPGWTSGALSKTGGRKKSLISCPQWCGNWPLKRWLENHADLFTLERFNSTYVLCGRVSSGLELPGCWGRAERWGRVDWSLSVITTHCYQQVQMIFVYSKYSMCWLDIHIYIS